MKPFRLGLALFAVASSAFGQAPPAESRLQTEASTAAAACVVMGQEPVAFPANMPAKSGGTVRVRLTFTVADQAPSAEVFYDIVGGPFRESVLDRVKSYRLPCLSPGDPAVVVTQEFVFYAGDGRPVTWSPVRDVAGPDRQALTSCLLGADELPAYPDSRLDKVKNGSVYARFTFTRPDAAPNVDVLFDGGSRRFAQYVSEYAARLRLPCLPVGAEPLTALQSFRFVMPGAPQHLLQDATLKAFIGSIDKLEQHRVRFDFSSMGCPFDVRFVLRQPILSNAVGEVERSDPNRREFLEWLKRVDLRLPASARSEVIGDSMTISVPCGVLDLT